MRPNRKITEQQPPSPENKKTKKHVLSTPVPLFYYYLGDF